MTDELTWEAPGPGPWMQDKSHLATMTSEIARTAFPQGFMRGFGETFSKYGALLDGMNAATVNGFLYLQPRPFDAPGPDGPRTHEYLGAEIGRRTELAARVMADKIWLEDLRSWDEEVKPRTLATNAAFHAVDLPSLSDDDLAAQLEAREAHLREMMYQHHRFNVSALFPVGDFALQAAGMTHMSPLAMFAALDGTSPVSGLVTPELAPAVAAVRADPDAERLARGDGDPATRLRALRERVPAIDAWLAATEYRIVDGFDVISPTLMECPGIALGKLVAALDADPDEAHHRGLAAAASIRARVPDDQRPLFDDLLASARAVYRLRDERGLYSDTSATGLMRLAMLEAGRRLVARGRLEEPSQAVEASLPELLGLLRGASAPTAADLAARTQMRARLGLNTAPALLGPPPPPPPPVDQLPPPLARLMSAVGFVLDGVLGQMPEATGTASVVVGIPIGNSVYEGRARIVLSTEELFDLEQGEVLVAAATGESFNSMLHLVGAIVTDHGSFASHAAIMARELGFPAVVGTVDGTSRIRTGDLVRVDGTTGEVTVLS